MVFAQEGGRVVVGRGIQATEPGVLSFRKGADRVPGEHGQASWRVTGNDTAACKHVFRVVLDTDEGALLARGLE